MNRSTPALDGLDFVPVPADPVEEPVLVRSVLAAHAALSHVYRELAARSTGDRGLLAKLLAADWGQRAAPVAEKLERLLAAAASGAEEPSLPKVDPAAVAERITQAADDGAWLALVEEVADRCAISLPLVPLGNVSPELQCAFREIVEAEDLHLSQIAWLRGVHADVGSDAASRSAPQG